MYNRAFLIPLFRKKTAGVIAAPAPPDASALTARPMNTAIFLTVIPGTVHNLATGHRFQLRRRRQNNNNWSGIQTAMDIGAELSRVITEFNSGNPIENDRDHQVRVQAYNAIGDSAWSDWVTVTPTDETSFTLTAENNAIGMNIEYVADPRSAFEILLFRYQISRWDATNTAWINQLSDSSQVNVSSFIARDDGTLYFKIVGFTSVGDVYETIKNGERYRVRVRAAGHSFTGPWTAYEEITLP